MNQGMPNPVLSGTLQTKDRKRIGTVYLYLSTSDNEKAPKYWGTLKTSKGKFGVSLWPFKPKQSKPQPKPEYQQEEEDFGEQGEESPFPIEKRKQLSPEHIERGLCWRCGNWLTKKDTDKQYCSACLPKVINARWEVY